LLAELEMQSKEQGLHFIDELIFENGAVYKGKLKFNLNQSAFLPALLSDSYFPTSSEPARLACPIAPIVSRVMQLLAAVQSAGKPVMEAYL
jgi:hypothetical protein